MRVRLRSTTAQDLDFVLAAEHDAENLPFIGQWTREQHAAALQDEDVAHMLLERSEDGARVGYAILTGLSDPTDGIRLRRLCVTEKGKGYGGEALQLVKQLVFDELQAPRLWLIVRNHNLRARRLYESAGIVREARGPEVRAGDGAGSHIVMSVRNPRNGLSRDQ